MQRLELAVWLQGVGPTGTAPECECVFVLALLLSGSVSIASVQGGPKNADALTFKQVHIIDW